MRERNGTGLRSCLQPQMHGVPPEMLLLLLPRMSSSLSEQCQDDWLESGETPNEKLEHQVPPTGYSQTDTCRKLPAINKT